MDPMTNPYTPNAGVRPPQLAGREGTTYWFEIMVRRAREGHTDKALLLRGLRGVGKTVLLNEFARIARAQHATAIKIEATPKGGSFQRRFPALARQALLRMSPADRWKDRSKRAAAVLKGFKASYDPEGKWSIGYDVADATGLADTGDFGVDLPHVMVALGEAAQEQQRVLVLLVDEVQYLSVDEFDALIRSKHETNQLGLPVVVAGAGLPPIEPLYAYDVSTHVPRMFHLEDIGNLQPDQAAAALQAPAAALGVRFTIDAIDCIVDYSQGYPYFLQEYGRAAWNHTAASLITLQDVTQCQHEVETVLDRDFFPVLVGALTPDELAVVKALAELGTGGHPLQSVLDAAASQRGGHAAGSQASQLDEIVAREIVTRLDSKHVIYKPRWGYVAFTTPLFDQYVARAM